MSFTSFLKEKQYLENVSTNTLRWYKHALKWLPCESPDEAALIFTGQVTRRTNAAAAIIILG